MKLSQFKQFLLPCLGFFLIASCGGGNNASRATGWDINSKKGGFQFNIEFEDQIPIRKNILLKKGDNHILSSLIIDNPILWWPKGYGKPHLYQF